MDWLMILLSPFVVVFVYPVVLLIMMYGSAVFLHVYRHRRREIYDAYTGNFWDGAMQTVAAVFDSHGSLWHGYELLGMDKLPAKGPALLIYYHGALPLDMYYILARLLLCKKRRLRNVSATFLFHIPGIQLLLEVCGAVEGHSREQCVEILKNGELLAISPGGVREALFSDEYYTMIWNGRRGFAKVALEAQVPIYPVYTQNIREAIRSIQIGRKWFRKLYEWTKLPLVPLYGGFPVKLRTYIGNPVHYDAKMTCDELAGKKELLYNVGILWIDTYCLTYFQRISHSPKRPLVFLQPDKTQVQREIQEMIVTHQQLPGSIFAALQDRRNSTTDKKQM